MFESFNALINEPMSRHTTLRLGGPADYLVFPRSPEEIRAMFTEAGAYNVPVTVIGHGSNLLVLDGGTPSLPRQARCSAALPRKRRRPGCPAWNSLPASRGPSAVR